MAVAELAVAEDDEPKARDASREYFDSVRAMWHAKADDHGDKRTPMERSKDFAERFRASANQLAMGYGGPVYLVGSMLTTVNPGDVDLRIMLNRDDLEMWFGKEFDCHGVEWSPGRWRLEREQLKQSRRLSRRWRGYPARRFDLQFQSALFSDVDGLPIMGDRRPFLRLDTTPLELFAAGYGDP